MCDKNGEPHNLPSSAGLLLDFNMLETSSASTTVSVADSSLLLSRMFQKMFRGAPIFLLAHLLRILILPLCPIVVRKTISLRMLYIQWGLQEFRTTSF